MAKSFYEKLMAVTNNRQKAQSGGLPETAEAPERPVEDRQAKVRAAVADKLESTKNTERWEESRTKRKE